MPGSNIPPPDVPPTSIRFVPAERIEDGVVVSVNLGSRPSQEPEASPPMEGVLQGQLNESSAKDEEDGSTIVEVDGVLVQLPKDKTRKTKRSKNKKSKQDQRVVKN